MITSLGYGTYMFFGSLMVLMGIWAFFFIPETKGLTLEEMDRLFGGGDTAAVEDLEAKMRVEQVEEVDDRVEEKGGLREQKAVAV